MSAITFTDMIKIYTDVAGTENFNVNSHFHAWINSRKGTRHVKGHKKLVKRMKIAMNKNDFGIN